MIWINICKQLPPLNERILIRIEQSYSLKNVESIFFITIGKFTLQNGLHIYEKNYWDDRYGFSVTHWCHIPDIKLIDENGTYDSVRKDTGEI